MKSHHFWLVWMPLMPRTEYQGRHDRKSLTVTGIVITVIIGVE